MLPEAHIITIVTNRQPHTMQHVHPPSLPHNRAKVIDLQESFRRTALSLLLNIKRFWLILRKTKGIRIRQRCSKDWWCIWYEEKFLHLQTFSTPLFSHINRFHIYLCIWSATWQTPPTLRTRATARWSIGCLKAGDAMCPSIQPSGVQAMATAAVAAVEAAPGAEIFRREACARAT